MIERRIPLRWALIAVAWTAFGLTYGLLATLGAGSRATWQAAMVPTMGSAWFWLAATPLLAALARRIRALKQPWYVRGLAHVVPCLVMVLATAAVMYGLRGLVTSAANSYWVRVFVNGDVSVIQYVAVVMLAHAWDRHVDLAQRERRALVLEQQLVHARLLYLERQLRPHFLFNCLNAIAEIAHVTPGASARMIASLRRLLASAVETAGRTEIPLREELITLDAYLDLQRARFVGAIVVEVITGDDVLDARVPPLLLQPVVENAIQHGLDRADGAGLVRITISTHGEQLLIEVEDNGSAGPAPMARGFGIGLRNTRERIETLYGETRSSLELELRPSGGAVTRIQIPRTRADAGADDAPAFDLSGAAGELDRDDAASAGIAPVPITSRLPIVWAVCLALPFFWSTQIYLLFLTIDGEATFELSGPDSVAAVAWMVMAPIALYLAARFPIRGEHLRRNIALHLLLGVGASLMEGVVVTATGLHGDRPILAAANAHQRVLDVLAYLALVGWTQVDVFARWFQERGVVASRLRADIERARWRAATLELQPTLVLAALETAEQQVVVSVEQAEETLYELSELLRSQLDLSRETHTTLEAEVRQIASTERLRAMTSSPGPRVTVMLSEQLSAVRVPSGVLRRMVQAVSAELADSTMVELRLTAIRYARSRMSMQLAILIDGEPLAPQATARVARRIERLDAALGHVEVRADAPGEVTILTDLVVLDTPDGPFEHSAEYPIPSSTLAYASSDRR